MECMWNFNGVSVYIASNSIVGRMLIQDNVTQDEWEIKDGGLEPEVDME